MAFETILYEVENAVATVTINRPDVLNALNPQVTDELAEVFNQIAADDAVKVVILTGAGGKAFVAGADIAAMSKMTPIQSRNFSRKLQGVTTQMENLAKPIICAVSGFALGGGTELAMACDFVYATEKSKFGQPEITLGIIPGAGGTQRLSRLVGRSWAKELCLTGDIIRAEQARELGLVNKVFAVDELMPAVQKTAAKIAGFGKAAIRAIKEVINAGCEVPMEHGLLLEAEAFATCFASPDQAEGMGAFLEKRKPEFTGEG